MDCNDILSYSLPELTDAIINIGEPNFRAKQIFDWLHRRRAISFDEMTNLPKTLREKLADSYIIYRTEIAKKLESKYDDTIKYLYRLNDGEYVETVLMKYKYGWSACVSSQVGCNMGCSFCASGLDGCVRSLKASEILSQIYTAENDNDITVSHVVLMGMGEPLLNFDNVIRFIELITDINGQNMSARHISLSTCGIVPGINRLAGLDMQLTLSVSLHAPNDTIRSGMMPVNKKYNIDELLSACRDYTEKTHRRISFEYALVAGVNDSSSCARELAKRLRGMLCHVNLIPVNNVQESGYHKPDKKMILRFQSILNESGITTTVRRELGSDINASCGQLRRANKEV